MNLRDLAESLGCSHMTVSRALRGAPGVSEEQAQKIREEAARQGYRSNPLVSALMQVRRQSRHSQKAVNLAFIHRHIKSTGWANLPYSKQLFLGAKKRSEQLGYSLDPVWAGEPGMTPQRLHHILQARGIQGILLAPRAGHTPDIALPWEHYALVALGFSHSGLHIHQAGTYFHHVIPIAFRKLVELGYQRIGVATSRHSNQRFDYAWDTGIAAIRDQFPRKRPSVLRAESLTPDQLSRWLHKERVDAVINAGAGDVRAMLKRAGIDVPGQVGYVSLLDGDDSASVMRDWQGIGTAAIELIDYQLMRNERGLPTQPRCVLIEGKWRTGKTVRSMR